jgi:hypothetical protein
LLCAALLQSLFLHSPRPSNPPPDGGYANGNTAEGQDALFSLTTGENKPALGLNALYVNSSGNFNTATGERDVAQRISEGASRSRNSGMKLVS